MNKIILSLLIILITVLIAIGCNRNTKREQIKELALSCYMTGYNEGGSSMLEVVIRNIESPKGIKTEYYMYRSLDSLRYTFIIDSLLENNLIKND